MSISHKLRLSIWVAQAMVPVAAGGQFTPFTPPRALPMPFAERRQMDLFCDNDGASNDPDKKKSNKAKNNFSAPAPAVSLTFADFVLLQKKIDDAPGTFPPRTGHDGYNNKKFSRSKLRDIITVSDGGSSTLIGERDRVVLIAIVKSARHAHSWPLGAGENGEDVNCDSDRMNRNDIHIELVEKEHDIDDNSKRLTAEISPHFRPLIWERFDTNDKTAPNVVDVTDINNNKRLTGKPGIKELRGKTVRIYGHLYFDDVHRPCFEGPPCKRLSTWEVHPVYWIDVEENKEWVPFHEWASRR